MINIGNSFTLDLNLPDEAIPLHMIWVEPRKFTMGDSKLHSYERDIFNMYEDDLEEAYPFRKWKVELTKGYWLAKYPTTQAHWNSIGMNDVIKNIKLYDTIQKRYHRENNLISKFADEYNFPVYKANWLDAILFCQTLNMKYKDILPKGYHFNLPTEAQWECAVLTNDYQETKVDDYLEYLEVKEIIEGTDENSWGFSNMIGNV